MLGSVRGVPGSRHSYRDCFLSLSASGDCDAVPIVIVNLYVILDV